MSVVDEAKSDRNACIRCRSDVGTVVCCVSKVIDCVSSNFSCCVLTMSHRLWPAAARLPRRATVLRPDNSAALSASISAVIASSPLLFTAGWWLVTAGAAMQRTEYRVHRRPLMLCSKCLCGTSCLWLLPFYLHYGRVYLIGIGPGSFG